MLALVDPDGSKAPSFALMGGYFLEIWGWREQVSVRGWKRVVTGGLLGREKGGNVGGEMERKLRRL